MPLKRASSPVSGVGSASSARVSQVAYAVPGAELQEQEQEPERVRRPAVRRPIDKRNADRNLRLRPRD